VDTQTLQTVITMLNTLGASTREVFIWWLVINYGLAYLIGIAWTVIGGLAILRGLQFLHTVVYCTRIGRACGFSPPFLDEEVDSICKQIKELRERKHNG
jgi:hypothetical protein